MATARQEEKRNTMRRLSRQASIIFIGALALVFVVSLSLLALGQAADEQVNSLTGGQRTSSSLQMSWDAIAESDLDFYRIYRGDEALATTTFTSFTDTGLNASTTYSYRVAAVDEDGDEGPRSASLSLTTLGTDTTPPLITGLDTIDSTDVSIRAVWQTDEPADSTVRYGLNDPDRVAQDNGIVTNHSVQLSGLTNGTVYNFIAISCDQAGNCANQTSHFTAGKDTTPPKIEVDIPRYLSRVSLDIVGETEPESEVTLYVNNMNSPERFLEREDTGEEGAIRFRNIFLGEENVIRIVAEDKAGNVNERLYEVDVDTTEPVISFSQGVPSVTSRKNLTLNGVVTEDVVIRVFTESAEEAKTPPGNVSGFANGSVGKNFVTLEWEDVRDDDFSHYVIYRDDVGPIAAANPESYTSYTDILVDSGKQYAYQISYVNVHGIEGPRSPPVTVQTETGGSVTGILPPRVDIRQDFREPLAHINASGRFSLSFVLDGGDGVYDVKIEVVDKAGNRVVEEHTLTLDTSIPTISITKPPSGALLFENYAEEVDIEGMTEPNSKVYLYVGRTPFNFENLSFDIPGLKDRIQDLDESDLSPSCRAVIRSENFCPHSADQVTTADAEGRFGFSDVDVTSMFAGAGRINEVSVKNFADSANTELREERQAKLVFVSEDAAGLRNVKEHDMRIGNCWSGNLSWDVIPLTEYQRPTLISSERLAENTEQIYFYFNYSYTGIGEDPAITSVALKRACGDYELLDGRFNTSCKVLPAGAQSMQLNEEGTLSYSTIKLNRIDGMDRWLEKEWQGFFDAVGNEMTFPFRMTISYEHEVDGQVKRETQTTCQEVTYVMDNTKIDPRSVLPDWLLYDFVDFLDESIMTIADIQEQVDGLIQFVAPTCLMSFGVNFGASVLRHWSVYFEEAKLKFSQAGEIIGLGDAFSFETSDQQTQDYCKQLVEAFEKSQAYNGFKLEYLSDADLETCFPSVASAWENEETTYKAYRYTCDRLFGHSTPSRWTETKADQDLLARVEQGNACALDESPKGQPLRAALCKDLAISYKQGVAAYEDGAICAEISTTTNTETIKSLYTIKEPVSPNSNLYRLEKISDDRSKRESYAIKINDRNYLTARSASCTEICGGTIGQGNTQDQLSTATIGGDTASATVSREGEGNFGYCTTANKCISLNARASQDDPITLQVGGQTHDIVSAEREGYTSPGTDGAPGCFYNPRNANTNVVSDDPDLRIECCCLTTKEAKQQDQYVYYAKGDQYKDPVIQQLSQRQGNEIHTLQQNIPSGAAFEPIEFSYRYSKNNFVVRDSQSSKLKTAYNPYRYLDGRDHPACFGQNHWAYSLFGSEETLLTIEPSDDPVASLQCANLGGIQNWLTATANGMNLMSSCLKSVRTTGTADAGACKELFTQYVCSFAWDIVQFAAHVGDSCNSFFPGYSTSPEEDDLSLISYVSGGLNGVYSAMADKQKEFTSEYSNTKLREMFGVGEEAIARKVCLAAFGYDWEINSEGLIDAAYSQPFASFVQATTASREFLTAEPDGESRHEYRASWVINPGCDLRNYDVRLACITRDELDAGIGADCTEQNSKDGINCACLDGEGHERSFFREGTPLGQNEIVDDDHHEIVNSRYRYDHLKFNLRVDRDIDGAIADRCFPQGYEEGEFYFPITDRTPYDIADCRVEPVSGVYSCAPGDNFFNQKGTAYFQDLKINGEDAEDVEVLAVSKPLFVEAQVFKSSSEDKCLLVELDRVAGQDQVWPIRTDGLNQVPPLELTNSLVLTPGGESPVLAPEGIDAVKHQAQTNPEDVRFQVSFKDVDGNGFFTVAADEAMIDGVTLKNSQILGNGQRQSETRVDIIDNNLVLSRNGAAIRVTNVRFSVDGNIVDEVGGTITASRATGLETQRSGTATITFGLYHLRDGSTAFTSKDDCNLNDPVVYSGNRQKRSFDVRVSTQTVDEAAQEGKPQFRNVDLPEELKFQSSQTLTADVFDANGLASFTALFSTADGSASFERAFTAAGTIRNNLLLSWSEFSKAGSYDVTLRATDRETPANTAEYEATLEVECAQDAVCRPSCNPSNAESSPALECAADPAAPDQGSQVCCKLS